MKIPKGRRGRAGPILRTDVVDVQVFRVEGEGVGRRVEFLQLLRSDGSLTGTWQPVMGHAHVGESAVACALRELEEEVGLAPGMADLVGVWALEQVHPFFLAHVDVIMLSPRFCAQVTQQWTPTLNHEHSDHRWVAAEEAKRAFMWPGQAAAIREILEYIVEGSSLVRERVRVV